VAETAGGQKAHVMTERTINQMIDTARKLGWQDGWKQGFFAALLSFLLGALFMLAALR